MLAERRSAIFSTAMNDGAVICVIEMDESRASLSLAPIIVNAVLDEHHLPLHAVVIATHHTVPRNSRGQKLRLLLRRRFLNGIPNAFFVVFNG
jgi:hypothetical protein